MNVSFSNIFAGILFGAIGFSAFMYEKKQRDYKALVIGIILMGYNLLCSKYPRCVWNWSRSNGCAFYWLSNRD